MRERLLLLLLAVSSSRSVCLSKECKRRAESSFMDSRALVTALFIVLDGIASFGCIASSLEGGNGFVFLCAAAAALSGMPQVILAFADINPRHGMVYLIAEVLCLIAVLIGASALATSSAQTYWAFLAALPPFAALCDDNTVKKLLKNNYPSLSADPPKSQSKRQSAATMRSYYL